jgi:hypothetical protein
MENFEHLYGNVSFLASLIQCEQQDLHQKYRYKPLGL